MDSDIVSPLFSILKYTLQVHFHHRLLLQFILHSISVDPDGLFILAEIQLREVELVCALARWDSFAEIPSKYQSTSAEQNHIRAQSMDSK